MLDAEDMDEAKTSPTPVQRRRAMGRSAGVRFLYAIIRRTET